MSQSFIDVHTFDGKLTDIFNPKTLLNISQKETLFNDFYTSLTQENAKKALLMIKNDLYAPPHANNNFQSENNIDASDLLVDLITSINQSKNNDLLLLLNEQLSDIMLLGTCNSGRVTRLLQLWNTLQ